MEDPAERSSLMTSSMKKDRQKPDWGRFGLSEEQVQEAEQRKLQDSEQSYQHHTDPSEQNELFNEDQSAQSKPWWQANFFISEPVLFGTWDGVFTSCMINIFGVIIFLRTGWMVGNAGIGFSLLIIMLTIVVALIAAMSAIGVCERCRMESGGVYFLLSHVLGARIGASVGILYCFGQAVACSLYVVGFGESISSLIHQDNPWISRGIATGIILLLLGINVAGVKWVIRLQLVLLMVLFVAVLDFLVGSFVHTDKEYGFYGYTQHILANNTGPGYLEGETFFSVFGVFFPTATGVFAGINMSGDLKNPKRNIPVGTLSAVGVSTFLYISFAVVLGATCMRQHLQMDYMIAERVSIVGVLFLAGLYISSISSCMGGLYGSPRILQCIANEGVIPVMKFLGKGVAIMGYFCTSGFYMTAISAAMGYFGDPARILRAISHDQYSAEHRMYLKLVLRYLSSGRGPNKVPVYALIVIAVISLIFIIIGKVNTLGPIVTMPFMLTYAAVDYCYFSLAMSFDRRKAREARFMDPKSYVKPYHDKPKDNGALSPVQTGTQGVNYGAIGQKRGDSATDLDNLFPERRQHEVHQVAPAGSLGSPTFVKQPPEGFGTGVGASEGLAGGGGTADTVSMTSEADDTAGLLGKQASSAPRPANTEITSQPRSFYSVFCNRWFSLLGALASVVIMFGIQWGYALANITIALVAYIYIGHANPGVFPGIAEFSMYEWIRDGLRSCCRRGPAPPEQIVVTPNTPAMKTMAAQLTEDNEDFAERGRYHQSEIVQGENFDDYDSN